MTGITSVSTGTYRETSIVPTSWTKRTLSRGREGAVQRGGARMVGQGQDIEDTYCTLSSSTCVCVRRAESVKVGWGCVCLYTCVCVRVCLCGGRVFGLLFRYKRTIYKLLSPPGTEPPPHPPVFYSQRENTAAATVVVVVVVVGCVCVEKRTRKKTQNKTGKQRCCRYEDSDHNAKDSTVAFFVRSCRKN